MNNDQKHEIVTICDKLSNVAFVVNREITEEKPNISMVYELAAYLQDLEAKLLTIPHIRKKHDF